MKTAWYSNKWVVVLLHIAAWTLLFSLPYLLHPTYGPAKTEPVNKDPADPILLRWLNNTYFVLAFYLNALVLIPRLFYSRKYLQFAALHLLVFLTFLLGLRLFFLLAHFPIAFDWRNTTILCIFVYLLFLLPSSTAYRVIRDRIRSERVAREKENENLKTELLFLRNQVSPHFMFNVLNNMVALARKQSALLEPSLIKLSSLLRYMLYETDDERVPLEREVEYLQSFIDLQRQRFGEKIKVTVAMNEIDNSYAIEPMLLIPFVENAFKHGTGLVQDGHIDIRLRAEHDLLCFSVGNKYDSASFEVKDKSSGIGLPNVKRRLNLLYGKAHRLQIDKSADWFIVSLEIQLH
jgi:two-component system, LytTR family, sensor kinase